MARQTSFDKFLNPSNPAFELNGYIVTTVRDSVGNPTVYLLDPDACAEAAATHAETGRFPGSGIETVVGYVGVFYHDGTFVQGEYLKLLYSDGIGFDNTEVAKGYYLRKSSGRKPAYPTYKSLVAAASRQSPEFARRRKAEQAAAAAAESERHATALDRIRDLRDVQEIKNWQYQFNARRADHERQIRRTLEALISRSQEMLDLLNAHPDAHFSSAFHPDGRLVEELQKAVAAREEILLVIQNSPLFVLFEKEAADVAS